MVGGRPLSLVIPLAVMLALLGGCKGKQGASTSGDIVVGEFPSLTGSTAAWGTDMHTGNQLAIDEINAAGGINGRQLKLITEDDQSKPDVSRAVVAKLVTQGKAVAILGEVSSTRTIAAAPVCNNHKIPLISPAATNPRVTQIGSYIFRVCFTDNFQAAAVGRFAYDQGFRRAAIFCDMKNDYSVGFSKDFVSEFTKLGGKIVGQQQYQEGDPEFKPQLSALKALSPDCLLVPGYYSEVGTIARQAREIGLTVPLVGGDGWDSPKLVPGAGKALEGCFFSNHFSPSDATTPTARKFVDTYKKRYGQTPGAFAALAYDSAMVLADAMKRSKSLAGEDLREAIASTRDFEGVTGKITIDANRNARKPIVILQVRGDRFAIFKSYTPEQLGQ